MIGTIGYESLVPGTGILVMPGLGRQKQKNLKLQAFGGL